MSAGRLTRLFISATAKHLPPAASTLHLLDVGGVAGAILGETRADLHPIPAPVDASAWHDLPAVAGGVDAITALDADLTPDFLRAAWAVLRPGGRLIVVQRAGAPQESHLRALENAGFVRILVEPALAFPTPTGALLRGERPHTTAHTLTRIQQIATQDADSIDWQAYKGRYVHLLVIQSPNKPVWALAEDERITWQAVTAGGRVLAFSSLPKAVGFMQAAVLAGALSGINKMPKFSKHTAQMWESVLLNPTLESVQSAGFGWREIDPRTAEAPDE